VSAVLAAQPLRALQGDGPDPARRKSPRAADERAIDQPEPCLICRACALPIADPRSIFRLGEGPQIYLNPHGILHELLLVAAAQNLLLVGEATTEHTWFAGYAWRIALCARCHAHLGWRYEAAPGEARSPAIFFGLRRAALSGLGS
jgi:hypothetical protein